MRRLQEPGVEPSLSASRRALRATLLRVLPAALPLSLVVFAGHAAAATCSASTVGAAFGSYDVFAGTASTTTGSVKVSCSLGAELFVTINYTISLSAGSSNSFAQRTMKSGANTLGYNLYTSNAYSTVWGDGSGSTSTVSGNMTVWFFVPNASTTTTVYGRVPASQDVAVANNYQDNVTVTVTY